MVFNTRDSDPEWNGKCPRYNLVLALGYHLGIPVGPTCSGASIINSTIIVNFILFRNRFRGGTHHRISEMRYGHFDLEEFIGSTVVSCARITFPCKK